MAILCFFALILTSFVQNVSAIVSYHQKYLLDIRTAITNLDLDEDVYFNELEAQDILPTLDHSRDPKKKKAT